MKTKKRPYLIGSTFIGNLPISRKLSLSFAMVVGVPLIIIGLTLLASMQATATITRTNESQLPSTLAASHAQVNLLRMMSYLHSYLVLGDKQSMTSYLEAEANFKQDLVYLNQLSGTLSAENRQRVTSLQDFFNRWLSYPEKLFALHDDQMDREPAYALLNTRGTELGGQVLIQTNTLIDALAAQDPSPQNNALLRDVAKFQSSFAAMFSGLRGYVTTRNSLFRYYEYENNLVINNEVWQRLMSQEATLTDDQRTIIASIDSNRKAFLTEVPEQTFAIMQSPQWRLDLALFSSEVIPLTDSMEQLLQQLTTSQQDELKVDLNDGAQKLDAARTQQMAGAIAAVLLGMMFALFFRQTIVGPIVRLTQVTERIRGGDLQVLAPIESHDEIGVLASTFNNMTGQLRRTLRQVHLEKKRADNLLEVVIPIGVALASEREFDRLLENILQEAKSFCQANAGILYLRTDENQLKYVIVHNDMRKIALGGATGQSMAYPLLPLYDLVSGDPNYRNVAAFVALTGKSINIPNTNAASDFDINEDVDATASYSSLLAIPLQTNAGQVIGVLQLLDARDSDTGQIIPFDRNIQQMMETFSTLAVAALEAYIREQRLRKEITQLRIEIDQVKRQQQVSAIVESDFFQNLRSKAQAIRERSRNTSEDSPHAQGEPQQPSADESMPADQNISISTME